MQRIKNLPLRCYSSCKGTIIKLKTRKFDDGIDVAFLTIALVFAVLVFLDPTRSIPIYSCSNHHCQERENNVRINATDVRCRPVCVLELDREIPNSGVDGVHELQEHSLITSLPARLLLCIIAMILIFGHNINNNMKTQICLASLHGITWQTVLFRQLPLKTVTKVVGKLFACRFPYPLNVAAVACFAWVTKIDINEARDNNLSNYESILKLFTRTLKEGIRPVNTVHAVVVPADSRVIYVGGVVNDSIEQIKGVKYSLKTFLGRGVVPVCRDGHSLFSAVFYLSPGDYHHFHSPADWNTDLCRHFEGELLTVTPWVVRCVPGIFALNERVLLSGQWEHGFFAMTAVGALNVGSIHVKVCEDLVTSKDNDDYRFTPYTTRKLPQTPLSKGEYVGGFNLGSTIVLIFEAPNDFQFIVKDGDLVKYGQALGTLL